MFVSKFISPTTIPKMIVVVVNEQNVKYHIFIFSCMNASLELWLFIVQNCRLYLNLNLVMSKIFLLPTASAQHLKCLRAHHMQNHCLSIANCAQYYIMYSPLGLQKKLEGTLFLFMYPYTFCHHMCPYKFGFHLQIIIYSR